MFSIKLNSIDGLDIDTNYTFVSLNRCVSGNLQRDYIYDGQYPQGINLKTIKDYLTAKHYTTSPIQITAGGVNNLVNAINNPTSANANRFRNEYLWLFGSLESRAGLIFYNSTNANVINGMLFSLPENSSNMLGHNIINQPITSTVTDEGGDVITTPVDNYLFFGDNMYINGELQSNYGSVCYSTALTVEYFDGLEGITPKYYTDRKQNFTGVISFQGDASEAFAQIFGQATIRLCPSCWGAQRIGFDVFQAIKDGYEYIPDPNDGGGDSGDDGGGGGNTTSEDIPIPTLPPNKLLASGIIKMYNPTDTQMRDFTNFIYSSGDDIITNFKKIWVNPMESIITYSIVPFLVPHESTNRKMYFCGVDSNVSAPLLTSQYLQHDCGYVDVPEEAHSILDYANFTKAKLYLPFVGIVDLNVDECMNGRVSVTYNIDLLTGDCVAFVKCKKNTRVNSKTSITHNSVLYTFKGNCISQNPISGNSYQQLYSSIVNGIKAVALPSPASVAGLGSEIMGQKVSVQRSGTIVGNSGMLTDYVPYIILEKSIRNKPEEFGERRGYPSNRLMKLGDLDGYTLVDIDSMQFTSVDEQMTDNELQEIKQILSEGVYL